MFASLSYQLKRIDRGLRGRLTLLVPRMTSLLKTPVPFVTTQYKGRVGTRTLIVFLPGIGDLAEDFERRGFIDEMRRHGVEADAVVVDAHFGYYAKRIVFERMTDDVLAMAHTAGYDNIWLVGVSLGGFGAACYAARYRHLHQHRISGMLLIAPYLGVKALTEQISTAGGLHAWEPGYIPDVNVQRHLWSWFKQHVEDSAAAPSIYLGYGLNDGFAPANALLAQALSPEHVFAVPGGHDWRTWKKIWQLFLEAGQFDNNVR